MTIRQEKFCLEYAKTGNATEAYKKAGYSQTTESGMAVNACKLLKKANIQERLKEIADKIQSEKIADVSEIQERLTKILRMEETEDTVVIEGVEKGVSEAKVITRRPQLKDVIQAGTTLAKMQGAFNNEVKVTLTVPVIGGDEKLED